MSGWRNYDYYNHVKIGNLGELLDLTLKDYKNDIAFSYHIKNEKVRVVSIESKEQTTRHDNSIQFLTNNSNH